MKTLDELRMIQNEWEGDVHDLDYKIASGEIPKLDNADAKMKIELWFALRDALRRLEEIAKIIVTIRMGHYATTGDIADMLDNLLTGEQDA